MEDITPHIERLLQENANLRMFLEESQKMTEEARQVAGRLAFRFLKGPDADPWYAPTNWLHDAQEAAARQWYARHRLGDDDPGELKEWQDYDPDC